MKVRNFLEAGWSAALLESLKAEHADGLEISCSGHVTDEEKVSALQLIAASISKQMTTFDCWVVMGHTALQPDSRIVGYRKLWRSLGVQTEGVASQHVAEWAIRSDGGVRYFGVLRQPFNAWNLLSILNKEQISWVVITRSGLKAADFERKLEDGWSMSKQVIPSNLLHVVAKEDFLLLKDFGSPAQNEVGAIVVGRKERVSAIGFDLIRELKKAGPGPD